MVSFLPHLPIAFRGENTDGGQTVSLVPEANDFLNSNRNVFKSSNNIVPYYVTEASYGTSNSWTTIVL